MLSAASYPPLHKAQGQGTLCRGIFKKNSKGGPQALPGGGPLSQGLSGAAQDATLKFALQNLGAQRLGQATVNAAASIVGDIKIGYDLLAFMYAGYQCVK
jgi:hypothetical protein